MEAFKNPPCAQMTTVGALNVHHASHGPPHGDSLVFVHGSGPGASGHSNFKKNILAFAKAGYRVLVPDLPGFGYSSKPTDQDYTTEFFATHLVGLLNALGIRRFALIGNSLGGAVSIRVALDHPERVFKLILMAPGGIEDLETYLAMPAMTTMINHFVDGTLDRNGLRRVLETLVYDRRHVTDELVDERMVVLRKQPAEVLGRMKVPNMESELPRIACPVLSFWGVNDALLPASGGLKITRACRPSRHIELAECGHWVMVEHTRVFNAASLDFLEHD